MIEFLNDRLEGTVLPGSIFLEHSVEGRTTDNLRVLSFFFYLSIDPATGKRRRITIYATSKKEALQRLADLRARTASELTHRRVCIGDVLQNPADSVIVRFQDIVCEDPQSLVNFARWIEELRSNGHNVRLVAGEPHVELVA